MKKQLEQFTPTTEEERNEKAQLISVFQIAIECGLDIDTDFTTEERRKLNERINNLINQS